MAAKDLKSCEVSIHIADLDREPGVYGYVNYIRRIQLCTSIDDVDISAVHLTIEEAAKLGGLLIAAASLSQSVRWDDGVLISGVDSLCEQPERYDDSP